MTGRYAKLLNGTYLYEGDMNGAASYREEEGKGIIASTPAGIWFIQDEKGKVFAQSTTTVDPWSATEWMVDTATEKGFQPSSLIVVSPLVIALLPSWYIQYTSDPSTDR